MKTLYKVHLIIASTVLGLQLQGCGPSISRPPHVYEETSAYNLDSAGAYLQQASGKNEKDAQELYLEAADYYLRANHVDEAEDIIHSKVALDLNEVNEAHRNILLAKIALAHANSNEAANYLDEVWMPSKLPTKLQKKYFLTRATVFKRRGNFIDAIKELIYAAEQLPNEINLEQNDKAIWQILTQMTPSQLRELQNDKRSTLNGWLSFAHINKQYDSSSEQMLRALALWKDKYPAHPANKLVLKTGAIIQAKVEKSEIPKIKPISFYHDSNTIADNNLHIQKPEKVAVLLPLSGNHRQLAQAIRDGILAGYYSNNSPDKPELAFYDTNEIGDIEQAYRRAVHEQAGFVIGPLVKEEVETLSQYGRLPIPILALNTLPMNIRNRNSSFFQFGLPPENEALAVAERGWADGKRNALVIAPNTAWGKRIEKAFRIHFETLGGKVLNSKFLQTKTNLNNEMRHLLGIDSSEERARRLKKLGLKFSFEPRRRQDPDMVFIATNATLARQIKPLLNFYYAKNLQAYASSNILQGKNIPNRDRDLDGIWFCDMPWVLDSAMAARSTYKSVNTLWPSKFEQSSRLYALGLDAYRLTLQINQLLDMPDTGISGMTGMLTLDKNQVIHRDLMWAVFKNGAPKLHGTKS